MSLMQKNQISILYHWFDVPQIEASENCHYFQNWHIILISSDQALRSGTFTLICILKGLIG